MAFNTSGVLSRSAIFLPIAALRQCGHLLRGRSAGLISAGMIAASLSGCGVLERIDAEIDQLTPAGRAQAAAAAGPAAEAAPVEVDARHIPSAFLGVIIADDPQVVEIGRRVLAGGGSAADAATSVGLALAVTLPSRAGLDGGGACLVRHAGKTEIESLDFAPDAKGGAVPVPGLVRGLGALQTRDGVLHWQEVVAPVEALATRGITITAQLLGDLQAAGLAPTGPDGKPLRVGDALPQRALAEVLSRIRLGGPGELYGGTATLGGELVAAGLDGAALAAYRATWTPAATISDGGVRLALPHGAGGAVAEAAWRKLAAAGSADPTARAALARSVMTGPAEPVASTGFVTADAYGSVVACTLGMGHLFGTKSLVEPLAAFIAKPFDATSLLGQVPLIAQNPVTGQVTGAWVGAGNSAAASDTASIAWASTLGHRGLSQAVADPRDAGEASGLPSTGRVAGLVCPGGLGSAPTSCVVARDARGNGFALKADRLDR